MPTFIPGLKLNSLFYDEVVGPLLKQHFPDLPYASARIGEGSDVLGFDTEMSSDHGWGIKLLIFLRDQDAHLIDAVYTMTRTYFPHTFRDYPVNFLIDPEGKESDVLDPEHGQPLNHRVQVTTVRDFFQQRLAYDIDQPPDAADWLTISPQLLLEVTRGAVYHDDIGKLTALRERFTYYPHEIWLYLLAAGWNRIAQEEHLMPRAGFVGDELGSALIGSRLVRDIMNLCFLMEKRYAPYPKWFGTAFQQLSSAQHLTPVLRQVQAAQSWQERESPLCEAYEYLAHAHNALNITNTISPTVTQFHERPFRVLFAERFANEIAAQITDPTIQRIASRRRIGNIDQISDNTDIHCDAHWRQALRGLYM